MDTASPRHETADRAWRAAFLLVHVAFMILSVAGLMSIAKQRALTYAVRWGLSFEQFDQLMLVDRWGTFARLCLLAAGVYLAALIVRSDHRVPRYYRWYGGALVVFGFLLNLALLELWEIPQGTPRGPYLSQMAVYAAALLGWVVYVWRSRKVRTVFARAPRPLGPVGRLVIGLVAVLLITWPFILNRYVEATVGLAAYIAPKDASAGAGLAEGILLMSVVTGLFILMKNTWRMRNGWIAVLLPVCFMGLLLVYVMQGFGAYYRF